MTRYERMMLLFRRFLKMQKLYSQEIWKVNSRRNGDRFLPTQLQCSVNNKTVKEDGEWLIFITPYAINDLTAFVRHHYNITLSQKDCDLLKENIQNFRISSTLLSILERNGHKTNRWSLDWVLQKFLEEDNVELFLND